jgi:hypothetical protein
MTFIEAEKLGVFLEKSGYSVSGIGRSENGFAVFLENGNYCDGPANTQDRNLEPALARQLFKGRSCS